MNIFLKQAIKFLPPQFRVAAFISAYIISVALERKVIFNNKKRHSE